MSDEREDDGPIVYKKSIFDTRLTRYLFNHRRLVQFLLVLSGLFSGYIYWGTEWFGSGKKHLSADNNTELMSILIPNIAMIIIFFILTIIASAYKRRFDIWLGPIYELPDIENIEGRGLLLLYYIISIPLQYLAGYWISMVIIIHFFY